MNGRQWVFGAVALALAVACGPLYAEQSTRVVLEGVDQYRVVEPVAEGVRVILNYRGETYSPAYVQGISGAAFRISGPCPCAPTTWGTMPPQELARLFGYEARWMHIGGPYGDATLTPPPDVRAQNMRDALVRIRGEIRAGRPAILVHAFTTWEFDVICGFDENRHLLYGRGSYESMRKPEYAEADEMRALGATDIGGGPYAVFIGAKTGQYDARAAEVAALRGATEHARSHGVKQAMGMECYDLWIAQYQHQGNHMVPKGPAPDEYPLSILPSTRQAAADFMTELAPKYPRAKANLETASEDFAQESQALAAARKLRAAMGEKPSDEQCARMAGLLSRARAMYALATEEIERAVPLMEK